MEQETLFNILTGQYGEILETHAMWECVSALGIKPFKDGNLWCFLYGDNIQEGICGFGDTIDEALYQFLMEVLKIQKEQKPAEWSEEDENAITTAIRACRYMTENFENSTKQYEDAMERLKSLRSQPKQEWSKEDEKVWQDIFDLCNRFGYDDACRKLKSLRPQPAWKPSEQEKGALRTAICVLTEERNFPKTAGHLQAILDAFEGKESHKG